MPGSPLCSESMWGFSYEETLFLRARHTVWSWERGTLGWNASCQGAVLEAEPDSAACNESLGYIMGKC